MKHSRTTALLGLWLLLPALHAQTGSAATPAKIDDVTTQKLDTLSKALALTQQQLEQTQRQVDELRRQIEALRGQASTPAPTTSTSVAETVAHQQEEQEVLAAEVKQHDQTKLESVSKYPVRVYGLVLFNTFSNAGVVDNPDLPSAAVARTPGTSHGSLGASFRQSLFGISANGPRFLGARTSADISIDFFGDPTYNYYGSSNGNLRLRRGDIRMAWGANANAESSRDELHLGIDAPLISPLSPTSFATVAAPALAWSGNLWSWAPQLQYKHTFALPSTGRSLQAEAGLWDSPDVGISGASASRILSAGELSRRPGVLGRVSYHDPNGTALGIGGYTGSQTYANANTIQMWAITSDWHIPVAHRFELEGELYRGRGLGGLGGGAYKDVLTGADPITGATTSIGLNAVGGWAQWKTNLFQGAELNLIYGQDDAFSSDFRRLNLSATTFVLEQNARNHMMVANFVYRPKTYLILSPEYRRILSWRITGPVATANIFTLSLGYRF